MSGEDFHLPAERLDTVFDADESGTFGYVGSTNSVVCTGSAQSALYQQGAYYANGEFIQVHPTSIPGEDKLRLMSESARGEGGRVWVPKQKHDKRDPRCNAKSIHQKKRSIR